MSSGLVEGRGGGGVILEGETPVTRHSRLELIYIALLSNPRPIHQCLLSKGDGVLCECKVGLTLRLVRLPRRYVFWATNNIGRELGDSVQRREVERVGEAQEGCRAVGGTLF